MSEQAAIYSRPVQANRCVAVKIGRSSGRVSMAGETVTLIDPESGRRWYFEWHSFFGPQLVSLKGHGRPLPGSRSSFWPLLDRWTAAGKRVTDEGIGVLADDSRATPQGEPRP